MSTSNAPPEIPVINLTKAGQGNYTSSRSKLVEILWYLVDALVMNNHLLPVSAVRVTALRLFGAKVGHECRFVHPIRVRSPWNLELGDRVWLGNGVYIWNQGLIRIGSDVCLSQGVFLTSGSHDASTNMDLRVDPIFIEDGVWISSFAVIQKGVTIGRSAVVTPLSVVFKSLPAGGVFGGNPCRMIKEDRFAG